MSFDEDVREDISKPDRSLSVTMSNKKLLRMIREEDTESNRYHKKKRLDVGTSVS